MAQHHDDLEEAVGETLERELRIVQEAIALVESGQTPRVVLASLALSDQLLEPAMALADGHDVHVTPIWHADENGLDLAIERVERTQASGR
jgi:hypothetical protein